MEGLSHPSSPPRQAPVPAIPSGSTPCQHFSAIYCTLKDDDWTTKTSLLSQLSTSLPPHPSFSDHSELQLLVQPFSSLLTDLRSNLVKTTSQTLTLLAKESRSREEQMGRNDPKAFAAFALALLPSYLACFAQTVKTIQGYAQASLMALVSMVRFPRAVPTIVQAVRTQKQKGARQICFQVLSGMMKEWGEDLVAYKLVLSQGLLRGVEDPSQAVRMEARNCFGIFVKVFGAEEGGRLVVDMIKTNERLRRMLGQECGRAKDTANVVVAAKRFKRPVVSKKVSQQKQPSRPQMMSKTAPATLTGISTAASSSSAVSISGRPPVAPSAPASVSAAAPSPTAVSAQSRASLESRKKGLSASAVFGGGLVDSPARPLRTLPANKVNQVEPPPAPALRTPSYCPPRQKQQQLQEQQLSSPSSPLRMSIETSLADAAAVQLQSVMRGVVLRKSLGGTALKKLAEGSVAKSMKERRKSCVGVAPLPPSPTRPTKTQSVLRAHKLHLDTLLEILKEEMKVISAFEGGDGEEDEYLEAVEVCLRQREELNENLRSDLVV